MKKLLMLTVLSVLSVLSVASVFAARCPQYNIGDTLPNYLEKDGYMVPVCPANFSKLGILVRVDATPDAGKIITQSHGEVQNGQWVEVIDEQLTQSEIDAANPLTALNIALSAEIASLNTDYPGLGLTIDDTLTSAIPKLFNAGVTKAEATYLFTLYSAIEKAQTQK